jgi:undecaprenyl-diphosphatase
VRYDRELLTVLRRCGDARHVARAARGLSWAGEHGAVWLLAGLAGAYDAAGPGAPDAAAAAAGRRTWLRATALVAGAHLTSMAVKRVVRRPRPELPGAAPLVRTAGRHSFPSSHAASSAAAVVAFGAVLPRARFAAAVPPLAAAVCVSRLVAGVHYPTDVVCGALLGGAMARLGRAWALAGV